MNCLSYDDDKRKSKQNVMIHLKKKYRTILRDPKYGHVGRHCAIIRQDPQMQLTPCFSHFFETVLQKPATKHTLPLLAESTYILNRLNFSEDIIVKVLNSIDLNKGPGSNKIPLYL